MAGGAEGPTDAEAVSGAVGEPLLTLGGDHVLRWLARERQDLVDPDRSRSRTIAWPS